MTPLKATPDYDENSSASTTPPSEVTLFSDQLVSELKTIPSTSQIPKEDYFSKFTNRINVSDAINTDYESSAAEDMESFTINKYENAEFALLSYSRTNKLDKLRALLDAKAKGDISLDLNFKGQQKKNFSWSALHLACYFGHKQVVDLILSRKEFREEVDINIQNNSGDTPLHKATLTNRGEIVHLLLSNGANVFIKNCDGQCAKQLTKEKHISSMLEAAEQVDKKRIRQELFKIVDNGDLGKLQEYFNSYCSSQDVSYVSNEVGSEDGCSQDIGVDTIQKELLDQTTDERGNTLLHLAAMRGFKAICIYLLEQGLDPYKKNQLGQNCIDLSSYQLRQLLASVKPANTQLKKLTKQGVGRFEGPLLKKSRILGWKQIYVVLENGVILLFNNRRDSMNRSRRGYKYLESATCEPEPNDYGTFTVCFSDRSRAVFLVTSSNVSSYAPMKLALADKSFQNPSSQIELVRQKWIDSVRDHIRYSTNFIKNGLKLNENDEECMNYEEGSDLSSLNHLLPIDTIKSFLQEARAHYSILERHSDSLCNLVQSITAQNRLSESYESRNDENHTNTVQTSVSSSTTSSRLLGFIRPARQNRDNQTSEVSTSTSTQQPRQSQSRSRNNSLTNEFIQDNWHCILFHLRLLIESTQNTKSSMAQALAIMDHQEQLRQNRIQDQEERCRVLEDSLHALARDHHELEKSISMSHIYHSAAARSLSMSMSTDLNEYFDAFEDFDDEKTMTPNSIPSDEDLNEKLAHVAEGDNYQFNANSRNLESVEATDDEVEDDVCSNCSALTVATLSEHCSNEVDERSINNAQTEHEVNCSFDNQKHRTRLPSPMVPRDQVSIWSILKNCIGKELSKITMPVVFNEPLTMLQRACEGIQYSQYLQKANQSNDPIERMELVCTFIVAGLSANCHRIIKPFNPLLYETYEYDHELEDGSHVKSVAQQVSHHPPITAAYSESDDFIYNGSVNPKIKFWGRSIEVLPDGQCRIYLKRHNESYIFKSVSCSIHNIIVGKLWFEHRGPMDIKCLETNIEANLVFKQAGWFSNDLHRFDGFIVGGEDKVEKRKFKFLYGKWSDYVKSVDYADYEKYMRDNQQKLFRIPDRPDCDNLNDMASRIDQLSISSNSVNNNSIISREEHSGTSTDLDDKSHANSNEKKSAYNKSVSTQSLDIPNSKTLWRLESQYLEEYYNFTQFTLKLNELTPELQHILPRTDSRFRPDVRKLELGDLEAAANEKQRLEEKQREARAKDKRFKDPSSDLLWFDLKNIPHSKDKFWIYKGGYWESKGNPERFPDLF